MKKTAALGILLLLNITIFAFPATKICSCAGVITTYKNSEGSTTSTCTGYGWEQPSGLPCDKMNMISGTAHYVSGIWVNNGQITWYDDGPINSPGDILCATN